MPNRQEIERTLARAFIGACIGAILSSKCPGPTDFNRPLLECLSTITGGFAGAAATSSKGKFEDILMRGCLAAVSVPALIGGWMMCVCNDHPDRYDDLTCAAIWRFCVYGWIFGITAAVLSSSLTIALTANPHQEEEQQQVRVQRPRRLP